MKNEMKTYKVCFVCTGNACRSPFAECVLRTLLAKESITGIEVLSRGTLNWGENPRDETMVQVAHEMGYELTGTTTPMTYETLNEVDVIVIFDTNHREAVTRVLDYCNWDRIVLFDKLSFQTETDVKDPHYQTIALYRKIANHIEQGCLKMIEQWKDVPPIAQS